MDLELCRERQQRLRAAIAADGLDAAVITNAGHVHYLTGCWKDRFPVALFLPLEGKSVLSIPSESAGEIVAGEVVVAELQRHATLVEDLIGSTFKPLLSHITRQKRVGCDEPAPSWLMGEVEIADLTVVMQAMRRRKDHDEIEILRHAIKATESVYRRAREILRPGLTEVELYAELHAEAVRASGEPLSIFGNDFQCGTPGGPPRHRAAAAGEIAVLDISVGVRGYSSDLCRSFVVGAEPTDLQLSAHRRIAGVLEYVEKTVRPGVSCLKLFEDARTMLEDNEYGWEFFHHLGHGIGLGGHEAPRLNPYWNDTFAEGDVFTAEPGLYGRDLRGGIRLEHNYVVTEDGLDRLSTFPIDL